MPKKTARKKGHSLITSTGHANKWSRPKGGWSNTSSSNKGRNTKVKLALLILGLIVLLILIGKILSFVTSLQKPIYADSAVSRNYIWDQNSNINFVIKSDKIAVLSFSPLDKKITILTLPDNLYLNVSGDLGSWKVASIYDLGQSGKQKNGGTLLKQTVGNFLGIPIEGYIVFNGDLAEKSAQDIVETIRDGLWNGFSMLSSLNTDLTPKELLGLNLGIRGIRFDKVASLDLSSLQVLDEERLPDGTEVFVSDSVRVDRVAAKFFDPEISSEKLSVAVFNGTSFPGLAQKAARVISNLGGNVIISANSNAKRDKTVVFVNDLDQKNVATPQVLGEIFTSDCSDNLKCDIIVCKPSDTTEICKPDVQIIESRAQINVVLGEDFRSRF